MLSGEVSLLCIWVGVLVAKRASRENGAASLRVLVSVMVETLHGFHAKRAGQMHIGNVLRVLFFLLALVSGKASDTRTYAPMCAGALEG